MNSELNILAISYAKRALQEDSREQRRMISYAQAVDDYRIIVFTKKKDNLPEIYKKENLTVYGTNTRTRVGILLKAYTIGKKILEERKQKNWVVSSQDPFITSIVGRMLSRAKNATHHVQVHGDSFSLKQTKSLWKRLWNIYAVYILRHSDAIRVVSQRAKKSIVSLGVDASKITVLPITEDVRPFLEVGAKRRYENVTPVTFLYVGRLSSEKNIARIIRSFAEVYILNKNIRLHIVGEGKCRQSLQDLTKKYHIEEVVTFVPWSDDVPKCMSGADVFTFASLHEGYGLVLIEAMASGLPVVTTDVGCVGEVLIDKQHGIVVSDDTDESYIQALHKMVTNEAKRKECGQNGYQTIKKLNQSQEIYIQKWKDSFKVIG